VDFSFEIRRGGGEREKRFFPFLFFPDRRVKVKGSLFLRSFFAAGRRRPEKKKLDRFPPSFRFLSISSPVMVSVAVTGAALGVAFQVYANAVS